MSHPWELLWDEQETFPCWEGLSVELGAASHTSSRVLRSKSLSGSSSCFSLAFPTFQRCFCAQ